MKKLFLVSLMIALSVSVARSQESRRSLGLEPRSLSLSFSGGGVIPAAGTYDATTDIAGLLKSGPTLGISIGYSLSPILGLRGSYDFSYNNVQESYRPAGKTPAFVAPTVSADLVLKFGSFIETDGVLNPYCFSGAGVAWWKFSQDGTCGKDKGIPASTPAGSEWKDWSFDLHTGIGTEAYVSQNVSLFAEGKYRIIFSKNAASFGDHFGNLQFVRISAGATYYFSLGGNHN